MAALDVVGLDVEVGHALGPRTLAERQVAVRLERHRAPRLLTDADEAGVHALRRVLHRALEQQVAVRLGCDVVLQRAEVVHLRAVGVVQRHLLGGTALAGEPGIGAHTGIVAAEGDGGQQRRAVAFAGGLLVAELPDLRAQKVDAEIGDPCGLRRVHEQPGYHEGVHVFGALEALDDGELAVGTGVDDEAGIDSSTVLANGATLDVMGDDDRCCEHLAGRRWPPCGGRRRSVRRRRRARPCRRPARRPAPGRRRAPARRR
jgi:hypothetical protein